MTEAEHPTGPYLLMSTSDPHLFWGNGADGPDWGKLDFSRVHFYETDVVNETDPGEDGIFVEIVDRAPNFPLQSGLHQKANDMMARDYERWLPRANEIARDPFTEDLAFLVGLHADDHDFYYRLRGQDGRDTFLSMACGLEIFRDYVSAEEYASEEARLLSDGAEKAPSFIVTREVTKTWPAPRNPAAFVLIFSECDWLIFGPFHDPESLNKIKIALRDKSWMAFTTNWLKRFSGSKSFSGTEIPTDLEGRCSMQEDTEDYLSLMSKFIDAETKGASISMSFS